MNPRSVIRIGRDRPMARRDVSDIFGWLQREIGRLFEDFARGWPAGDERFLELSPSIDVIESDKEIEITAELPGLEEKDVEVNVVDNVLTIKGEKKAEKEEKGRIYRVYERSYGAFYRSLELPAGVDVEGISATLANGVLKVTVPKAAPAQVKKIDVKAAA